jgi:RimJ/RimL family protein N-acetyltransferase
MEELKSKLLKLRPATLQDKRNVYNWLAHSNLTREMLGPPNFSDNPIPTWDEFNLDYLDHYFDGSQPLKGQCFILIYNGRQIGQINYNPIDSIRKSTEIDIWLADREHIGKGLGTEAIKNLCYYLNNNFDCETIYIAPSKRNKMAIKAYKKAGFIETNSIPNNFVPDYVDTVVLEKKFKNETDENELNIGTKKTMP